MLAGWRGKCLLKLEPELPPTAGNTQVELRAWIMQLHYVCVMNPPCRTQTHRRQRNTVYEGLTRCTKGQVEVKLPSYSLLSLASMKKDVQDGIDSCQQDPQAAFPQPQLLCLDHTLGTDSSVQALRLQEAEQGCGTLMTRMEREFGMFSPVAWREKAVCRLQDTFGPLSPPLPPWSLLPLPPSHHPSNSSTPQPAWH